MSRRTGSRRITLGALLPAFLVLTLCIWWHFDYAPFATALRPQPDDLLTDPSQLELGEVWRHRTLTHDLTLHNRSNDEVRIDRFISSCACTSIEPSSLRLLPSASETVRFTFDLTYVASADQPVTPFRIQVAPLIHGRPRSASPLWYISGQIRSPGYAVPSNFQFLGANCLRLGKDSSPDYDIELHWFSNIKNIEAIVEPDVFSAVIEPREKPGDRDRITIAPNDQLTAGLFECVVSVLATDHRGVRLPPLEIPINGYVIGEVHAVPQRLHFGAIDAGSEGSLPFSVHSSTGEPFRIGDAVAMNDEVFPRLPSTSDRYDLEHVGHIDIVAVDAGPFASSVKLNAHTKNGSVLVVELPIDAYILSE